LNAHPARRNRPRSRRSAAHTRVAPASVGCGRVVYRHPLFAGTYEPATKPGSVASTLLMLVLRWNRSRRPRGTSRMCGRG
jgi:hypothetical protein